MKRLLFGMALILMFANACKKDGIAYGGDYGRSNIAWRDFKAVTGDSYIYQVVTSSWIGYNTETTITVKQGKVTERSYIAKANDSTGQIIVLQEWKEDETQLGTHDKATLLTMDEVYAKAKDDWLLKRDNAENYFEAKNNGMISLCGYEMKGCQDDCFNGIVIKYIRGL